MARLAATVGFSVTPELVADIDEVAEYFTDGNRSAFLRMAVQDYRSRMHRERMETYRAEAHRQLGQSLTEEAVPALIADTIANS